MQLETFYYIERRGKRINVPKGTLGASVEARWIPESSLSVLSPEKLDTQGFQDWLETASADELERFGARAF